VTELLATSTVETEQVYRPRLRITASVRVAFTCKKCAREHLFRMDPWPADKPLPDGAVDTVGAFGCPCGAVTLARDVVPIGPGVELVA